jgi:protein-S-isoprenylcysteine O-methyltransferase Ste14
MEQTPAIAASRRVRPLGHSFHFGRRLFDSFLPALLFGAAALARCLSLLSQSQRGPTDPSLQAWLLYSLDLAHQGLSFLFLGLIATLFLVRHPPRGGRAGALPMGVALLGSFIMNAAAFQPVTTRDLHVLALADLLMALGLVFTLYTAASLRYCFGIAPEARGLVTSGPYRLVRHPMYLGEFVSWLGAILPVLSPLTLGIYGLFCALQASRAILEERVLAAAFPEYAAYRRRTPAVLPWPRPSLPSPSR